MYYVYKVLYIIVTTLSLKILKNQYSTSIGTDLKNQPFQDPLSFLFFTLHFYIFQKTQKSLL